ncbi:hypothetical protein [uncultured Corynebacterium sp.]|uniref:hypothetical protein n=1 Tax=uncultured Corynebacterium sp. TaxID=159447 RepID=UPI0025EE9D19|nr:hypothetical protein [uncultured Corynebacterium sp.]
MSRLTRAALAAFATGALFLGACSSEEPATADDSSPATENSSSESPSEPGIGDRVEAEGVAVTIDEVTEANELEWNEHLEESPDGTLSARDGGKLVLVKTTVENTWNQDFNPTCNDIDVNLHGDNDAKYGPVPNLFGYPHNKGCDGQLGVGFDEEATFVFEVPEEVTPVAFDFTLFLNSEGEPGVIRIDEVKDEADADRPEPTNDATTPERTADATTRQAPADPAPAQQEAPATTAPERGYTGAPQGEPTPLPGKTIASCASAADGLYEQGTTWFTDGTTGWTETCAAQF